MTEPFQRLRRFLRELKRRNVYKVAVAYAAAAFVVVQAARLLVPALLLPDWIYRAVVLAALLGFPLALVLAWAFEMTAEGVRRTPDAEGEASGRGTYQWVGLALVVALAGGVWYGTAGSDGPSSARKATSADTATEPDSLTSRLGSRSIAVLPFEALGQKQPGPFTEGMHDALLTRLSNVSGLKVISRTAVQQYRGSEKTTGEIARELGVRWVLEGGVQEMGDQIQVNAQLIDPRTETHAWADTYRRDLTAEQLFALQTELTKRIARSLEAELTREETERVERRPTGDLDAYKLYVQGRTQLNNRTAEGMRKAVDYFQRAIGQDSSYALAWAGLADAIGLYPNYASDSLPGTVPDREVAARRALELDSDLAEARASLGFIYFHQENGPAALRELRRAVELKPSYAQAHHWFGFLLWNLGQLEAGREHVSLAVELNPQHLAARQVLILLLVGDGKVQEAQTHLRHMPEDHPVYTLGQSGVLYHARKWNELEQLAREELSKKEESLWRFFLARIMARRGDTAAAREHLGELREAGSHFQAGLVHAALGETDAAFAAWQRAEDWPVWILRYWYPDVLGPLRDDPRFRELIREANRDWGLNPDGSLPDSVDVSFKSESDE